ncbi:MAG: arginine--tRNA ligase [Firmicutes bacterium]|nr:arginine--tRNA ligase [Bacillota bacterium]
MKTILKNVIKQSLNNIGIDNDIPIIIDIPKDKNNGDYSSNIAMQLTRILKINPREIATKIVNNINNENIIKVEIAGPGFLNFFVKKDYLLNNINAVLENTDSYGKCNCGDSKKVNIEYVSANPTGFLHIGHARGASYGDSLARIMSFAGYDVTREYYINDAGNQINNLEKSIKVRYENLCGIDSELPENGYHGKDIIEVAKSIYEEYKKEAPTNIFRKKGVEFLLKQIKKDLSDFDIDFDVWYSETSLYEDNSVNNVLNNLIKNGYTYESEDAIWLKTTMFGDEKDRVLVKSDKNNTYLLPDIAYHINKYSRGYDSLIDVLGADHHGYIARLKASIKMMGYDPDKLDVKILQMVRLLKDGEEIKLSKRTGKTITLTELLEEVGKDASRYFFSMRSLDSQMDFDMTLATKKSNENPVYYIQYAHARICSIIREYNKEIKPIEKYETINSEYALDLLNKVYEFKDIVEISAKKREPHLIANYVYELASSFHSYYAHEKVLTDDLKYTEERINLIASVAITIKNACYLLGVSAPEKM